MTKELKGLITLLQPAEREPSNLLKVLRCFVERGVASTDQVVVLSGLSYDAAYKALTRLCTSLGGVDPNLRLAHVGLEGEKGKPRRVHILTDTGAAALRMVDDIADLRAPKLEEHAEIAAAVMEMDIYAAARQASLKAQIEQVLPFGEDGRYVRADVLISPSSGKPMIFECEQNAAAWSKARLLDKLRRLARFFGSDAGKRIDGNVRVLFNIRLDDVQTLQTWQAQLAVVEKEYGKKLPFSLYWLRLADFIKKPEWTSVAGFQPLIPVMAAAESEKPPAAPAKAAEVMGALPAAVQASVSSLKELDLLLGLMYEDQQAVFQQYQSSQNPRQRSLAFFALMLFIYEASHYRHSPTLEYAALPVESLYLLRRYLHAHQNARLLTQIKQGLSTAAKNADGVTRYRNAMTRFIWDVFLRWHGFARGGPLRVKVEPPGFETGRSDFYVEVRVSNHDMLNKPPYYGSTYDSMCDEEKALAWVLEAMVNYPAELGLD